MSEASSPPETGLPDKGNTQEQAQDTGTNATEPKPVRVNLHDLPEFQAIQSVYESQKSEANRRADEAERQARMATERAKYIEDAVASLGGKASVEEIAKAAKSAENALKAEEYDKLVADMAAKGAVEGYKAQVLTWAAANKIKTDTDEFEMAFAYAAQTRDTRFLDQMAARAAQPAQSPSSPATENAATSPQAPSQPQITLPPAGRSVRPNQARLEELSGELAELLSEPTKNAARIKELRNERTQLMS